MKYPIHKHSKTIEREARLEVATRDAASFVSSLLNVLPNPDPILRKTGKRLEVYRNLTADWEVFSAIEFIHGGLQELEWQLEQGDADAAAFEAFEKRFANWDIEKILSEVVDARMFGYQPFELMWENDELWTISSIVGKPPEWFNFNLDNELQFKSKSHRLGEPVLPYKFVCAQHRESYDNPYGQAVLSRVFWPVTFKKGGIEFLTKFLEKFGIPWVIGKQPPGQSDKAKDKLLDDLANMVQDAVAVIPDDSSVEVMSSEGKGVNTDLFMKFVYYFDATINKVLLSSETAMSVSKEGSDVRGDGGEHAKVSRSVIRAIGGMAEKVVNTAIRWEWHFNHDGPPPVFSIYEPAKVQKDLAERDNTLGKQGVRFKKNYYMNHYGLNEDEFELVDPEAAAPPGFSRKPGKAHFQEDPDAGRMAGYQRILDEMIEAFGGDEAAAQNQQLMEAVLQPVVDLVEGADSMDEIFREMAEQFPEMSTEQLEERIMRAMFLADIWGRLTAAEDEEQDEE